jgi:hypothetical protein
MSDLRSGIGKLRSAALTQERSAASRLALFDRAAAHGNLLSSVNSNR